MNSGRRRRRRSRLEARRRAARLGRRAPASTATTPSAARSASATSRWRRASTSTTRPSRTGRRSSTRTAPTGERARREFGADAGAARSAASSARSGCSSAIRYENSPICVPDGTPPPPDDPATYVPNARPGARAPHVWLKDGSSISRSVRPRLRAAALCRRAGAGGARCAPRKRAACRSTVDDIDQAEAAAIYARRLVLVRPDGHVAWRADEVPADAGALIDRVRGA